MPRRKRNYLPGMPYHLVQRGNNRQCCFHDAEDFSHYLALWREKAPWYGVDVHAYCLMTNHIHFIVTGHDEEAISNTMKVVGSQYAYHFNRRHQRTGTLWEGRHRPSLIDEDNYLLTCYRYVELNPVRARMTDDPQTYAWSSCASNTQAAPTSWLVPHPSFLSLGRDGATRAAAYRNLLAQSLRDDDLRLIRTAAHYCTPVGGTAFCRGIAERFGIRCGYTRRGRPRGAKGKRVVKI